MANIELSEAQAWLESTKADLGASLDAALEASISAQVLSRVSLSYDVSTWANAAVTPTLVRKVIAMKYAAAYYQRQYSEDDGLSEYGLMLNAQADLLIEGIITGANDLPEVEGIGGPLGAGSPAYELPTTAAFTMGRVF